MTPSGIIYRPRKEAPARTAGRPTRHEAAALPARILDAAQELFLTQGFEATSLNQLAVCAGVTKRTLYVKVGDKAELFAAMVRRMLDQRRERLSDIGAAEPVAARLAGFGDDVLAIALDPDVLRLLRLLVAEAPRFPGLALLMREQLTQGVQRRLAEILADESRRGRLAVDDPETAARLLLDMIIGAPQRDVLFGLTQWEAESCRRWIRAAVDLFLQGCQGR